MAEVRPLNALHYDPSRAGRIDDLVAPPYDVIDAADRRELAGRSPYNVVEVDLPEGEEPYASAASTFARWREEGVVVRDGEPAVWAVVQDYTGPDGSAYTRHGFFARVRVVEYGPGRVRPHERTHPGPKEDRLRLTRATRANLSPIFALYDDPGNAAWAAIEPHTHARPFADLEDADGTRHRVWRVGDPAVLDAVRRATEPAELLIADGHHRYETARVYAEELGGEGAHRYVLTCLVALQDPGLTVFPTHRLLTHLGDGRRQEALAKAIRRDWDVEEVPLEALEAPASAAGVVRLGYLDAHLGRGFRLTLKDPAIADAALPGKPEPYRRLDTAVLEALILKGTLGMSDDDISHLNGLDYARSADEARRRVLDGEADAAFFMGATPVQRIGEVAAAGEVMPPKSTYFFPKVLTGLLFNDLAGE